MKEKSLLLNMTIFGVNTTTQVMSFETHFGVVHEFFQCDYSAAAKMSVVLMKRVCLHLDLSQSVAEPNAFD